MPCYRYRREASLGRAHSHGIDSWRYHLLESGRIAALLQVGAHDINQFLGSFHLGRVLAVVGGQDVEEDVSFHDLGHKTIQRPTASSHELKDSGAFLLRVERPLNGVYLPTNPSDTYQKLFFVFARVCHFFTIL